MNDGSLASRVSLRDLEKYDDQVDRVRLLMSTMSERGVYGRPYVGVEAQQSALAVGAPTPNGNTKSLLYVGIVGAGVLVGVVSWPYEKTPLGAIGLNASGVMVGAGLLALLQQAVERWDSD